MSNFIKNNYENMILKLYGNYKLNLTKTNTILTIQGIQKEYMYKMKEM